MIEHRRLFPLEVNQGLLHSSSNNVFAHGGQSEVQFLFDVFEHNEDYLSQKS